MIIVRSFVKTENCCGSKLRRSWMFIERHELTEASSVRGDMSRLTGLTISKALEL